MSLVGLMESWANKLRTAIGQSDTMQVSDWLKLEKALFDWQSLLEDMLQNVSSSQSESGTAQKKPHVEYVRTHLADTDSLTKKHTRYFTN